jgi:hypothetical protein
MQVPNRTLLGSFKMMLISMKDAKEKKDPILVKEKKDQIIEEIKNYIEKLHKIIPPEEFNSSHQKLIEAEKIFITIIEANLENDIELSMTRKTDFKNMQNQSLKEFIEILSKHHAPEETIRAYESVLN